jgi:hypothetical protein
MSIEGISGETSEVDIFDPPAAEGDRYPEMGQAAQKGREAAQPALAVRHETTTTIGKWQEAMRVVKT